MILTWKHWLFIALAIAGPVLILSPQTGLVPPLYRYNTSISVPPGPYLYSTKWPPEIGDIVLVLDPPGFRLRWLLKRVQGVGGDRFCWHADENRHYINDRPMPSIPPEAVRMQIPIWTGCRVLAADEVVGFGDHHLAYGSAYIGPVRFDQLGGVYRLW